MSKKEQKKKEPVTKMFRGWITLRADDEARNILFVGGTKESWFDKEMDGPLAKSVEWLMRIHGDFLTVRYWISDKDQPLEEIKAEFLQEVMGVASADYGHRYSEITGYLWTDEELKVGGHDLIEELKTFKGKFLHLEITFEKDKE